MMRVVVIHVTSDVLEAVRMTPFEGQLLFWGGIVLLLGIFKYFSWRISK